MKLVLKNVVWFSVRCSGLLFSSGDIMLVIMVLIISCMKVCSDEVRLC